MIASRPWGEIGEGEQHEGEAAQRPSGDRPAQPFDDLPEVVRAGDEPEPTALRDRITGLTGSAQVNESVFDAEIEREPGEENQRTCQKAEVG